MIIRTKRDTCRVESRWDFRSLRLPVIGLIILVAGNVCAQSLQSLHDADLGSQYFVNAAAAGAATEKALAQMSSDFLTGGGAPQVSSNLSFYATLVPRASDNPYWTNYIFFDPNTGATNRLAVDYLQSVTNAALDGLGTGMSGIESTYQLIANAKTVSDPNGIRAAQCQQTVALESVPLFGFAFFYNSLLEFSDTATLVVNGRVHANGNIYVGSPANLTFNNFVTCTGTISAPSNVGLTTNHWTGKVNYNASPSPSFVTNTPNIFLSIGTNTSGTAAQQILYPPPPGEAYNSPLGQQRYYNKAFMTLFVSNTTFTATFKSAPDDLLPMTFTTNLTMLTSNSWLSNGAINNNPNWGTNGAWGWNWNWLTTTNVFKDWRENKTVKVTQINVSKMTNWMGTWLSAAYNTNVNSKFSAANPFNIIYVYDCRDTNSTTVTAVRLVNGTNLPAAGLTIATPNPMYIQGIYNCPNPALQSTTNTTFSAPASVAADAITLLSPSWTDAGSWTELGETASRNDTVNTAMIAGIVPSTGTDANDNSGGAMNFTRLLEDWRSVNLSMNTSIVCLFSSTWTTGPFQFPGSYYFAPNSRTISFDQNYAYFNKLPPGTPQIMLPVKRISEAITNANSAR